MMRLILFNTVLLVTIGYVWWRGGKPERWTVTMFAAAAMATYLLSAMTLSSYVEIEWQRVAIDALLLVGLLLIVAFADRFWPIWCTAFHVLALAGHGVRLIDPLVLPAIYYRVTAWSAYPTLLIVAIGAWRHRRRLLAGRHDYSWTFERHATRLSTHSDGRAAEQ